MTRLHPFAPEPCVTLSQVPLYFTFRDENGWAEDTLLRHVEPGLVYQLELERLANYKVRYMPTGNNTQHIYFAEATRNGTPERRFFIRTIVHHEDLKSHEESLEYWSFEAERVVVEALSALEVARTERQYDGADCNHVYLNFLPTITMTLDAATTFIVRLLAKHGAHLFKLRVTDGEVVASVRETPGAEAQRVRWFIHNEAGFIQDNTLRVYREEVPDKSRPHHRILVPVRLQLTELHISLRCAIELQ